MQQQETKKKKRNQKPEHDTVHGWVLEHRRANTLAYANRRPAILISQTSTAHPHVFNGLDIPDLDEDEEEEEMDSYPLIDEDSTRNKTCVPHA